MTSSDHRRLRHAGHDLAAALAGRDVTALGRADLDVTDLDAVRRAVAGHDVVINAAAYTKVDDAETHEDEAYAVNAIGAGNLATAAAEPARARAGLHRLRLRRLGDRPVRRGPPLRPDLRLRSHEGRRRASWCWPSNPERQLHRAHGLAVRRARRQLRRHDAALAADARHRERRQRPARSAHLDGAISPRSIVALLDADAPAGIYHGTNAGQASWFDFAQAVFEAAGLDPDRVTPTDSAPFVRPAPRPAYSVLGHDAWATAGLSPMRDWQDALADAARSERSANRLTPVPLLVLTMRAASRRPACRPCVTDHPFDANRGAVRAPCE